MFDTEIVFEEDFAMFLYGFEYKIGNYTIGFSFQVKFSIIFEYRRRGEVYGLSAIC